jgi:hypothetical protein
MSGSFMERFLGTYALQVPRHVSCCCRPRWRSCWHCLPKRMIPPRCWSCLLSSAAGVSIFDGVGEPNPCHNGEWPICSMLDFNFIANDEKADAWTWGEQCRLLRGHGRGMLVSLFRSHNTERGPNMLNGLSLKLQGLCSLNQMEVVEKLGTLNF